jgi:hypothetical protein
MALSAADRAEQAKLKIALQVDSDASKLENLASSLLSRLLGVPMPVAKAGFQHGGDAGTAGQQGRHLRLECKKYGDNTNLSERELLGEIDQALARDEALEGWVLITTRSVPEQLAQSLIQKGERVGVAVVIIDWQDNDIAPLAALCASDYGLVESEFSVEAGAAARALQPAAREAIAVLERSLQSWCLGFEVLRIRSHLKLDAIWNSARASNAELGQDVAGGAQRKKVKRRLVHDDLDDWWRGPARNDAPAAIIGFEGAGKTWAVLNWLIDRKVEHPIILTVPSSSTASLAEASEQSLRRFLAERLYTLSGIRGVDHWQRRLDRLLRRPGEEGPVITLFFDGLNQEPSIPWLQAVKTLQGNAFSGKVRVIVSTRNHYFEERLSRLNSLVVRAKVVRVDIYDVGPGGELDQMLAFEGLTRSDLHPDLVELARTPRLFKLVVQFRDRLVEAEQVTLHRVLWEYGRDTLGNRAGVSFSEMAWREWLAEIARQHRAGVQEYSLRTLGETANRPDLSQREVYARLSDIIDGRFAQPSASGSMQLTPTIVAHALGAALLTHLQEMCATDLAALQTEVNQWLDPIAGFDQRAEILRAAVSILVERGQSKTAIAGVLVTAWLQTQNITETHRRELKALAPNMPEALLDAVEQSEARAQESARLWAVNALRAIPRDNLSALAVIVTRARKWLSIVSRDVQNWPEMQAQIDKQRAERYKTRIGVDASGPLTVLGVELQLVDWADGRLQAVVPSIIEGFPLAHITPCFEAAAVSHAAGGQSKSWEVLKWLCHFNEVDSDEMAKELRLAADAMRRRISESGVHPELPAKAAALLLWLIGQEADDELAGEINPIIEYGLTYEKDYLANPIRSFFELERRHADLVLTDRTLPIYSRAQRVGEMWLDPTFEPPAEFVEELKNSATSFDVEKITRNAHPSPEEHFFEELEPVLARCAPDFLGDLTKRKLRSIASCPPEARYLNAIQSSAHFLLASSAEAAAAHILRVGGCEKDKDKEIIAVSQLLLLELPELGALDQFELLIAADLKFIPANFALVMRAPTTDEVDALIARYGAGSSKQQQDLIVLLSIHPIALSEKARSWLIDLARLERHEKRGVLFRVLSRCDGSRFGNILASEGWSWSPEADVWVNHFGTGALIEAEPALPFDQLAPRLAPWRLLEAARVRGADPADVRLAASIIGQVLGARKLEEPDAGSDLTVDRTEREFMPFVVSIKPRRAAEEQGNPLAALRAELDPEARTQAYRRAAETATARIDETRKSGASLYLVDIPALDMEPVLEHAGDMVVHWLEGCSERTDDFRRRVRLAEPAYLALCEALLKRDPARGLELWRALRGMMATSYLGAAGIDERLHLVFRTPNSAPVVELRNEMIALEYCSTDQALFELAVVASYNRKMSWLAQTIEAERASPRGWRQKRGALLSSFTAGNTLPDPAAWLEGEVTTHFEHLRRKAARSRWREACAHHWWRAYLSADNRTDAYAAWILFLRSADARVWIWMDEELAEKGYGKLGNLKYAHLRLNRAEIGRAMDKHNDRLSRNFLDTRIIEGFGPWVTRSNRY